MCQKTPVHVKIQEPSIKEDNYQLNEEKRRESNIIASRFIQGQSNVFTNNN